MICLFMLAINEDNKERAQSEVKITTLRQDDEVIPNTNDEPLEVAS